MYVEVIGSHGNAISPLASLPRLLPLFPLRVASFPQAHLLPPLSLRSPRVSPPPPGTCKYMVAWKLKRWQIFTEHVSTNLCRARDLGSIQKAERHASIFTKSIKKLWMLWWTPQKTKPVGADTTARPASTCKRTGTLHSHSNQRKQTCKKQKSAAKHRKAVFRQGSLFNPCP